MEARADAPPSVQEAYTWLIYHKLIVAYGGLNPPLYETTKLGNRFVRDLLLVPLFPVKETS